VAFAGYSLPRRLPSGVAVAGTWTDLLRVVALRERPLSAGAAKGVFGARGTLRQAADGGVAAAAGVPAAVWEAKLRRLELDGVDGAVGSGYDLVDCKLLTIDREPEVATFMLDSGLTTNLLSPGLRERLGLAVASQPVDAAGLGGAALGGQSTLLPGLLVLGDAPSDEAATRFEGVWEGDGWRALCAFDWDAWVASASADGRVNDGRIEWTVLPTPNMTMAQIEGLVGRRGFELVAGDLSQDKARFTGGGVSVEPKGSPLAPQERYEFRLDGEDIVEPIEGIRLSRAAARPSLSLRTPIMAASLPFVQADIAKEQGIEIEGMLGQLPLHRDVALEVDHSAGKLRAYRPGDAASVAGAAGLVKLPALDLASGLVGVRLAHAPLLDAGDAGGADVAGKSEAVDAIVDTGSANTILNWPAAEKLLGLREGDRVVKDAPLLRAIGIGGGQVDLPLLTLSMSLVAADASNPQLRPRPVQVAIGDAPIFEEIFGREEKGMLPFGLGPRALKPAALVGQDMLSQLHYMLVSAEPAVYAAPELARASDWTSGGHLDFVGIGDCVDEAGRRLQGMQKLACTLDDAAQECLRLPPGRCKGVAVTPRGRFQGLAYVFVQEGDEAEAALEGRGWRRYSAPEGEELAPAAADVVSTTGEREADDAQCFKWRSA